jgi:hypothetical protein
MSRKNKKDYSEKQLKDILSELLVNSIEDNGSRVLLARAAEQIAQRFNSSKKYIRKLFAKAKKNNQNIGRFTLSPQRPRKGNCGAKQVLDRTDLKNALANVPYEKRGTTRDVASALGISQATACRLIKFEGIVKCHSSSVKPTLTPEQEITRVLYASEKVFETINGTLKFKASYDEVMIDEKWFDYCRITQRVYLTEDEAEEENLPHRVTRHKSHIVKVMFLTAMARPRYDAEGNCTFDGKIGMWPFAEQVAAQRNSVNRPRGTLETKCISVKKRVYKDYMMNKVLPAIADKWPRNHEPELTIGIQADNPSSHNIWGDADWKEACQNQYQHFRFVKRTQPAQSPDTNILDLGIFASMQAEAHKLKQAKNVDELIENVLKAHQQYDHYKINKIWLTHQTVCDQILISLGGNKYKLPHVAKDAMARRNNNQLPASLALSESAVESYNFWNKNNNPP